MEEVNSSKSTPYAFQDVVSKENILAQRVYKIAEISQTPLYFFCNKIIGRLITVLTPGEFNNYNNKAVEIIRRASLVFFLAAPCALAALVTSPLAIAFNLIGDSLLGDQPYLCFLGTYAGKNTDTVATFNMSTLLPPMTLIDGVENSDERLKSIADELRDFQFVCGQEVDGASARFLATKLKPNFKEFYTYLGKSNAPLLPSGLFFACKENVRKVTVIPFTGAVQKAIKRELVVFELEKFYVATMHLDGGENSPQLTQTHFKEIQQANTALMKLKKPVILCGDFNEDRYKASDAYTALTETFVDCIGTPEPKIYTCTDELKIKRFGQSSAVVQESIDYITYSKNQNTLKVTCKKVSNQLSLSDHSIVKGKITYQA